MSSQRSGQLCCRCSLRAHPQIATICFNGAKAEESFQKYALPRLGARSDLAYYRLPSTSPAHASLSFAKKLAVKVGEFKIGDVVRIDAAAGNTIDSYIHMQGGRGVNAVLVEMSGAGSELAHDVAVHIAFARPKYLKRDDVPAEVVAHERATLETITRNEGKPEAALPKIVEGRVQGFFKDVALLEQPYAKDDSKSITQYIGAATIVRYAQVEIG